LRRDYFYFLTLRKLYIPKHNSILGSETISKLPSFGSEGNEHDFFPSLSNGANLRLKILTAPEKYESQYGEKIRLDIEVLGINAKCEGISVNGKYTVSSSAACWKELHEAWIWTDQKQSTRKEGDDWITAALDFNWMLTAKATSSGKTHYKLVAVEQL